MILNVKEKIAEMVESALQRAVADGMFGAGSLPVPKIEYPREEKFGDYSTPIAMEAARVLKKSPIDIGTVLKGYIEKSELAGAVEVVKPGFINIFLNQEFLVKRIDEILAERDEYGKQRKENPRRISVEFVSANPTGPLNIVSARAAAVGDTVANLLEACGESVDREFYINDYGNQVMLLGRSVLCRYRELQGEVVEFPEDGYHGEYVRDIAVYIRDNFENEVRTAAGEEELVELMARKAVEYNVSGQRRDLERFNVNFRRWFNESVLHADGSVETTFRILENLGVIYEEEGKKIFRSTDFGDDKDRVVVRDDGRPTYLLADIAYHRNKKDRAYDLMIDIWGPDHHGYIARLAGAMKALGCPENAFRVLIAQQVNLVMEGEMVKMSKRLGRFSTMSELLDEIGVDVARYFFTMRSTDSHLDFDLALAKRQSSENPVFYLQYAHARICSIFREAEKRGHRYEPGKRDDELLRNQEAIALLKLLARFPEEIADAAGAFEPHRIATFLMRLAQAYHRFYTEHRVLAEDATEANTNLALCDCVRIVMKNGLGLLGVSAPERM
jgi:arginyl-tRNA synthetase